MRRCGFSLWSWIIFVMGISTLQAETSFPVLQAVPWNGHKAATTLTFDGAAPAYLDVVIPELNRRQMRGTFFLIANQTDRKDEWRQAIKAGHEIGNLTLDCRHASDLSAGEENGQVVGARNVLQKEFGIHLYSFAYPFGEVSPGLKKWAEKTCFIARGKTDGLVSPEDPNLDWLCLPAKVTLSSNGLKIYQSWMDDAVGKGDWLIWAIGGVKEENLDQGLISRQDLTKICDYLQTQDIWVGTLVEVGSYLRALKLFRGADILTIGSEETYRWMVPDHYPVGVILKVRFVQANPSVQVWQKGERIFPDDQGNYQVSFNEGKLNLRQ